MNEAKKAKKLTVMEIKNIEPKANVYELNPYSRYIVMIPKSHLLPPPQANQIALDNGREIMKVMAAQRIPCAVLIGINEDVKFIELQDKKG